MKSAEEFQTMERKDRYGLVRGLYNLEEGALPIEVEAACYDAAGAIAATLYYGAQSGRYRGAYQQGSPLH